MPIGQWLQQQFSRGSERKRAARRDFQKRFAAQLSVKPLESRLVLSGGPVTTELALTLAGNLAITDVAIGGKNDNLTLTADVANDRLTIYDPTAILSVTGFTTATMSLDCHTAEVALSEITGGNALVNTLDGNDQLTIDYSLGLFSKAVAFDGGNSSGAPNDQLLLTGGGLLNTVAHTFTTETDGTIASTGNAIVSYQNLEGLNDFVSAMNRSFTFNGGDETITLTDDPAAGFNQIDSTVGVGLVFANPLGSLSVEAGSGNDHVITSPLDSALSAAINFQINGGSGTNEWTINTSLTADVDDVHITATAVQLQTNAVPKPTIGYADFGTLNVNTFDGSDNLTVQLGGILPATINLDGGSVATPDLVTVRGDQTLADQLLLENSQVNDQITGGVINLVDIDQLVVDLAGDNRDDQVTIERTFGLTGGTPSVMVQGDGSPLDRLIVNTEPTLISANLDVVAIDADSVDLVGWLPILYSGLEQVTLNTGAGDDLLTVTPSSNTRFVIDGGPASFPTFPGDRVEFNLMGVVTPILAILDPGAGLLSSANRRDVQLTNIETFATTGAGTFVVQLDANSSATNDAADGNADTFNLVRQGSTTEIAVNGQTVFRGELANIAEVQITGSADNDAATVDFAAGNPLSPGGLQFTGAGGTNSLQMIQGSVERVVHDVAGPQAGLITIDEIVGVGTVTSTIRYTQINAPLLDDLLTNTRELHLTSADDNVVLRDDPAANRSEIINAGGATFVDLIQRNSTNNLLITGNAGNDTFTIDSNGNTPGGTVAFVTFAVELIGGPGDLDRLVVNDTSNAANATLAVTETTLDFGGGVIRYRGMEDADLALGSGNDQVTITDDPLVNADPEANAAATFTLRTGAGDDVVNIASIDAGYRASTTIVGETGNDQITQLVDLTLGSALSAGNLTYAAEQIELAANLATTGGFAKYAGNVTLLTDVRIDTDDTDAGVAGGTIVFTQTVDSSLAGAKSLTLDAGIADVVFSAGVGVTQSLQNLTIDEAHHLSFLGQLQTLGNVTQTTGTGQTLFNGTAGSGIGGQLLVQTNEITLATGDIVTTGNIDLTAANQITLAANAGLNATAATIHLAANQDNVGNNNFTQDETAVIRTTSNAANAVTIVVGANGSAWISDIRAGSTGSITINAGSEIVDNSAAETPNVTAGQATLTAGTGIGVGSGAADFDTQLSFLTAPANGGDIVIQEVDALTLQGINTTGDQVQITAGGVLTIQDTTAVTNATGQVNNIPPILRIDEANPNDVILPGDPTQEISGTFGGNQLLGDNLELARNLTFTAFWADGVVSQVSGLNAGDTLTWIVGPQGQGTPIITPGLVHEGPIQIFVQRQYTFPFLQTVTTPELVSHFSINNDSKIVLQDQRAIPVNLNFTGPLAIATSISKADFRPPPILLVPPPVPVVEVRRPSPIVEIATATSSRTITYDEIQTSAEEVEEEEAQLYLVQVGIDGTEGPRIKIPLAELRNLAGLLDRLKTAPIPSGLYRIYHQEPGLTSRQLIEFRKAGKNIGDPVREPGRGSNPLDAEQKKPSDELPRNNQNSQHAPSPADEFPTQAFSRIARWRRQWEA